MAQHDYVIANGTGAAVRSDLNNGLAAIVSNNSGATEPATMYAYQWWSDTTTGLLKIRNAANNAWVTVGTLASANLGLAALASPTFTGTVTAPTFTASTAVNIPLGSAGSPTLFFTGDANTGLFSPGADAIALATAGTNRLHITSAGLVGIGTTSPLGPLQISNASDALVDITNTGTGLARTRYLTSDKYFHVGINDGAGSAFAGAGAYSALLWNSPATPLVFATSNTQRAQIDASGRLLVGTSTARSNFYNSTFSAKLQVEGTTYSDSSLSLVCNNSSADSSYINICRSKGSTIGSNTVVASADLLGQISFSGSDGSEFVAAAEIRGEVDGTPGSNDMPGRLIFATTADGATSPTERLRISQNGTFTGSATNDISDQRLKQNIQTIVDPLDKVKALIGRTFEWKPEAKMQDGVKYGFIAQEVEAVVPELVECGTGIRMLNSEGNVVQNSAEADESCEYAKSVQSSGVLPILVEAFKQALTKIETLEAKVAALEAS